MTITIAGQNGALSFSPNPASAAGLSVVFKNSDATAHRVVLNDGSIDTGEIAPGATSRAVTMPAAGTNYHCSIHPGMIGGISGTQGPPPPCTGPYCDPNY
jgi:plastocyanin